MDRPVVSIDEVDGISRVLLLSGVVQLAATAVTIEVEVHP